MRLLFVRHGDPDYENDTPTAKGRTEQGNNDTVCFFCHLGITCVFLSHLLGISPFILLHGFGFAPTSVTEVYTTWLRIMGPWLRL